MLVVILVTIVLLVAALGAYIGNLKRLGVRAKSLNWLEATTTFATFASVFIGAGAAVCIEMASNLGVGWGIVAGLLIVVFAWPVCFVLGLLPTKLYQMATEKRAVRVLGCGEHRSELGLTPEQSSPLLRVPEEALPQPLTISIVPNAKKDPLR